MKERADLAQGEVGRATSVINEYLAGILQIQLLSAEPLVLSRATSVWKQALMAQRKQRSIELRYAGTVNIAFVLSTVIVLGFGTMEALWSQLTIGGLVAFYACAGRIFQPVSTAMEVYSGVQRVGASIRRIRAILESDSRLADLGGISQPRLTLTDGISLNRVSYSYRPDQYAIHELTLHMNPQNTVAIVGPSGSGKSTLARLLVRLSDPHAGEILLDGYPFRDYSIAALRTTVCYVPQQPLLFDGSIAENLRLGKPEATDADLERVISVTQLSAVVGRLPKGLQTPIGPSGYSLSGGERQRVALARALLRDAPVLVMDESTSALDLPTEQRLLETVARHCQKSLLIVISHRVPSIRWADRIVVMSSGRIIAAGNHSTLFSECPLYRTLYESPSSIGVN
jgi:ABC-type bacteriocin/lantibiotic exporter with double-glycine peptidase domain